MNRDLNVKGTSKRSPRKKEPSPNKPKDIKILPDDATSNLKNLKAVKFLNADA